MVKRIKESKYPQPQFNGQMNSVASADGAFITNMGFKTFLFYIYVDYNEDDMSTKWCVDFESGINDSGCFDTQREAFNWALRQLNNYAKKIGFFN